MSNQVDINMAKGLAKNFIHASYYQYLNGKRDDLIIACANHLADTKGYPLTIAIDIAINELAAFEGQNALADINILKSNSSLVVIDDHHNHRRLYYTIEDILRTASVLTIKPIKANSQ
ncbi:hypothetical protein [Agitococcus lubricus]|uniref:Uncharacterized protein n=1 Tax=Agitococcus lubricus TaxID=1077255 RepID=A0A2T5J1C4_9GAMM|nr:hypothetical protein [Agitococcus lubricus]PTQ90250.1 hypothetical protein C8N29_1032 [Agitococcus lubricus]